MCPSYRVTRDERHSTRGRAKLLVELFQGEVTPSPGGTGTSREALDLCLSCKGCAVDCPTHVDMATYKAEFLAHHYAHRLRPRAMYALGLIAWACRIATRIPALTNRCLSAPLLGSTLKRLAGVTTNRPAPPFATDRGGGPYLGALRSRSSRRATNRCRLAGHLHRRLPPNARPGMGDALLEALGETVDVPTAGHAAPAALRHGHAATRTQVADQRLLDVLDPWINLDVPVVVVEPSCLAAFRDELPALLPTIHVHPNSHA